MEEIKGWRYRNRAMLADNSPHLEVNIKPIENGSIWKYRRGKRKPLLARWTSDFDCGYETEWFYVIKDTPFDLMSVKCKYRRNVTFGLRHFEVKAINPLEHLKELYEVAMAAYASYPKEYRPSMSYETYIKGLIEDAESEINHVVLGAFSLEDGKLCGYIIVDELEGYERASVMKAIPAYERLNVNDALLYGMLEYYKDKIAAGYYLDFGERNISHKTAIQDKIIRQYGFRKAYCKMNIRYSPLMGIAVGMLYPFKGLFSKLDTKHPMIHKINGALELERINRACK